jgi:hypothetical protein
VPENRKKKIEKRKNQQDQRFKMQIDKPISKQSQNSEKHSREGSYLFKQRKRIKKGV